MYTFICMYIYVHKYTNIYNFFAMLVTPSLHYNSPPPPGGKRGGGGESKKESKGEEVLIDCLVRLQLTQFILGKSKKR